LAVDNSPFGKPESAVCARVWKMNREVTAKEMVRSFVLMSYVLLGTFYSGVLPMALQAGAASEIGALP
jgi:hypothetical protein